MTSKKSDLLQNHPLCWGILHLFCDFLAACVQNNVAWNGLKNELAISVKGGTVLFWYVVSFTSKMVMKECISVCIMLWFLFQFFFFACVLHFMSALVKMQNLFFSPVHLSVWVSHININIFLRNDDSQLILHSCKAVGGKTEATICFSTCQTCSYCNIFWVLTSFNCERLSKKGFPCVRNNGCGLRVAILRGKKSSSVISFLLTTLCHCWSSC